MESQNVKSTRIMIQIDRTVIQYTLKPIKKIKSRGINSMTSEVNTHKQSKHVGNRHNIQEEETPQVCKGKVPSAIGA